MIGVLSSQSVISSGGYLAIFLLCVAQSCCIPTSSELTMGFAGVLAATGHLSLAGAIAVGVVGEVIGAYIAWLIGRTGGRAFITRYGRFVLITRTDLDRAEGWYQRHQRGGVFVGRLLPVIRGFVALVAGVAEVPLVSFLVFTTLGSLVWDGGMAGIGYGVGSSWRTITHAFSDAGYVLAAIVVVVLAAGVAHRWRAYRHTVDLERSQEGLAGVPGPAPDVTSRSVPQDPGRRGPQHRRRR
jgi:membrane protein DedA with SNARE-associated domain